MKLLGLPIKIIKIDPIEWENVRKGARYVHAIYRYGARTPILTEWRHTPVASLHILYEFSLQKNQAVLNERKRKRHGNKIKIYERVNSSCIFKVL